MGVVKNITRVLQQPLLHCTHAYGHLVAKGAGHSYELSPSQPSPFQGEGVVLRAFYNWRRYFERPTRQLVTLLLLPLFLLTACGFHLRGAVQLPRGMEVTYLQDQQPSSIIATPLRQMLTSNGARVTNNLDEATATLRILSEMFDRRVVSTGRTSKEKDYELVYTVTFSAQGKSSAWSADAQEVRITREMKFNEEQVLAKTAEQDQLRNVMVQDAARQILVRLQSRAK